MGLAQRLEAEADACADVVLPAHTPAFTSLAAVDRLPVGKHHHRASVRNGKTAFVIEAPLGEGAEQAIAARILCAAFALLQSPEP